MPVTDTDALSRVVLVRRHARAWDAALAELDLRLVRERAADLHAAADGDLVLRSAAGDLVIACAPLKAGRINRQALDRVTAARLWLELILDTVENDAFRGLDESWTCACRAVNNGGTTCVRCGQSRRVA